MSDEPVNGNRWLNRRVDDLIIELAKVRERIHEISNSVTPLLDHDRRITRLEARTENLNVTERAVEELHKSVEKLSARFDDVIKALYVGLIGFGAACASAGLFVFLAFR